MPRRQIVYRAHPMWSLMKFILLTNVLIGFVTCAYNIQIGMGIVSGTVMLAIVCLCLRIIGVCADYVVTPDESSSYTPPLYTERQRQTQKRDYIIVTNPDRTISVATRAFSEQPPRS
jgi:hypothetical protein